MKETNNVDYDTKPLTVADIQEQTRIYMDRLNTNKVSIAGTIISKRVSDLKPKIDKKTVEHITNEDGSPAFWSPYYSVTIAFKGGETSINVLEAWYPLLEFGQDVLFEGRKGLSFGNISDVFHSYTIL